jgi:hypothetical protein
MGEPIKAIRLVGIPKDGTPQKDFEDKMKDLGIHTGMLAFNPHTGEYSNRTVQFMWREYKHSRNFS